MNKIVYKKIKDYLIECGYEIGLYGEVLDRFPHHIGLPSTTHVTIKPDYSPIDGLATILVTPTEVSMWVLKIPCAYNEWVKYKSKEYAHTNEMADILMDYVEEPAGPWR